jgi:hypothetical protein
MTAGAGGLAIETVKRWRDLPQEGVASGLRGVGPRLAGVGERRPERRGPARGLLVEQVRRMHAVDAGAGMHARQAFGAPSAAGRDAVAALEARRSRLATSLQDARSRGDRRRIVSLQLRGRRVEADLAERRREIRGGREGGLLGGVRGSLGRAAPASWSRAREVRRLTRALDRAAQAPAGQLLRSGTRAAPLAGLAGISPAEYLRRPAAEQHRARLEIERELARRRQLLRDTASTRLGARGPTLAGVGGRSRDREQDPVPIARRARQFGSWLR